MADSCLFLLLWSWCPPTAGDVLGTRRIWTREKVSVLDDPLLMFLSVTLYCQCISGSVFRRPLPGDQGPYQSCAEIKVSGHLLLSEYSVDAVIVGTKSNCIGLCFQQRCVICTVRHCVDFSTLTRISGEPA